MAATPSLSCFVRLHFVDPEIQLRLIECLPSVMHVETRNDFGRWHSFIREEFDDGPFLDLSRFLALF
jgi:ABC-type sulfate transport system substrate-binding protein